MRNVFINAPTTYEHFPKLDDEQEKIYKSAKLEVNTEKINPFGVDYGGDGGQTLNSLRGDFTDKKYQIETRVKSYHIISNLQSDKPRQYNDNNNNDNVMAGNLIIRDVENIENDFKSKNSQTSDLKTSVTFTTTPNNLNFVTNITKRLNQMGIKTKIITDKSYKSAPTPNSTPSNQDFKFTTTVTGVLK